MPRVEVTVRVVMSGKGPGQDEHERSRFWAYTWTDDEWDDHKRAFSWSRFLQYKVQEAFEHLELNAGRDAGYVAL